MPGLTPSQTIGPFFHDGLRWALASASPQNSTIRVSGRVLDRDGKGVNDALLEVWQPGWGAAPFQRVYTGEAGEFAFAMPQPGSGQLHASVTLFARGLLCGLFTRVYLHASDDPAALDLPPGVPQAGRASLLARRQGDGTCHWDLRLQGEGETVFFEL